MGAAARARARYGNTISEGKRLWGLPSLDDMNKYRERYSQEGRDKSLDKAPPGATQYNLGWPEPPPLNPMFTRRFPTSPLPARPTRPAAQQEAPEEPEGHLFDTIPGGGGARVGNDPTAQPMQEAAQAHATGKGRQAPRPLREEAPSRGLVFPSPTPIDPKTVFPYGNKRVSLAHVSNLRQFKAVPLSEKYPVGQELRGALNDAERSA